MRPSAFLSSHPWVATAFAIGLLVGVLLALPLVPYVLPESYASLLGSGLGAFIAVSGAAWVATTATNRKDAVARAAIFELFERVHSDLGELLDSIPENPDELGDVSNVATRFKRSFQRASLRRKTMKTIFLQLGAPGVMAYADITRAMLSLQSFVHSMRPELGFHLADELNRTQDRLRSAKALIGKSLQRINH